MGYTRGSSWTFLDTVAHAQTEIIIDSTAGDISLSTITMPDYTGPLRQAFLVLTVQQVRNTNGANNNGINGIQKIQLQDSSLTYRDAISVQSGSFYTYPDTVIGGTFEYIGSVDLKQYLKPKGVYLIRWEDADAYFDSLVLYATQMKMKLYFGG